MALIKVDYDGLTQQASRLGGLTSSYEGLISQMKSLAVRIGEGWEGEASAAYQQKLTEYVQQTTTLTSALEAFRNYALNAVQGFEAADSECAAAIRNSF